MYYYHLQTEIEVTNFSILKFLRKWLKEKKKQEMRLINFGKNYSRIFLELNYTAIISKIYLKKFDFFQKK